MSLGKKWHALTSATEGGHTSFTQKDDVDLAPIKGRCVPWEAEMRLPGTNEEVSHSVQDREMRPIFWAKQQSETLKHQENANLYN